VWTKVPFSEPQSQIFHYIGSYHLLDFFGLISIIRGGSVHRARRPPGTTVPHQLLTLPLSNSPSRAIFLKFLPPLMLITHRR
jgi:hypothetical protein